MSEWLARLDGEGMGLRALCWLFDSGDTVVFERDGFHYLRTPIFDGLAEWGEVYEAAFALMPSLNGAAALELGDHRPVTLNCIVCVEDDGPTVVFANPVRVVGGARLLGRGTVLDADGVAVPQQPLSRKGLLLAQKDEAVRLALYFFDPPHDWVKLYKVYEIVGGDVGGDKGIVAVTRGTVTATDLGRFRGTANNYSAAGTAARHAQLGGGGKPMRATMALSEASSLIGTVLASWLQGK